MPNTENGFKEIRALLGEVDLPSMAVVGRSVGLPPPLPDAEKAVREALGAVELPGGSVAVAVGSRGIGHVDEIVAALVGVLEEAGASPFVVPAMGSHGASTGEGQKEVLEHLGISEGRIGCPIRATMETVALGSTPSGVEVYMDRNAYEADAVVVVNRVKPHTAFRGDLESGPTKMLAIGLGKQKGAHSVHAAGWENIHRTIPEAAGVIMESGKVAFGLCVLETVEGGEERPYKIEAIPAANLEEREKELLGEAKRNLLRLPFGEIDVLVVDEIGKNVSGDGADPNVTGRYPTPYASGGPRVGRMVFLDLTEETGSNANGVGMADTVTERLASKFDREATYFNALTSTAPEPVRLPMVLPDDRMAVAAALQMWSGVSTNKARLVHITNTLRLDRMSVSETMLEEVKKDESLRVVEESRPMRFDGDGNFLKV